MSQEVPIKKEHLKAFVLGGNSKCIVEDSATGTRHVVQLYNNRYNGPGVFSVSVDGMWAGYFSLTTSTFSTVNTNNQNREWFQEFMDLVLHNMVPESVRVYHTGRCGACGRDLTDPLSMYIGIGPTCRRRMHKQYPNLPK